MAASISAYSGGESLVEMNLPRFSLFGSVGRPTLGVSIIKSVLWFGKKRPNQNTDEQNCHNRVSNLHFLPFFASGGNGVLSKAFKASLNETPLRFGSITGTGRLLCFARFGFGTISLSAPSNVRGFWFYKAVLQAAKPVPSNCLPIG